MGDTFTNITHATIINRSNVSNSLNTAACQDDDLKKAIYQVVDFINKSGNKAAGEQFESFVTEVAKPEPKKSVLSALWTGTVAVLPSISTLVDAVAKIHTLFQ